MKTLTILLVAAALASATPAAADVIPVQKSAADNQGPSPIQAAGPILAGIAGIAAGAAIATFVVSTVAPTTALYPFAVAGAAVGAVAGWNAYKTVAAPMVRPAGVKMAEAPSLMQLAVDTRAAE